MTRDHKLRALVTRIHEWCADGSDALTHRAEQAEAAVAAKDAEIATLKSHDHERLRDAEYDAMWMRAEKAAREIARLTADPARQALIAAVQRSRWSTSSTLQEAWNYLRTLEDAARAWVTTQQEPKP